MWKSKLVWKLFGNMKGPWRRDFVCLHVAVVMAFKLHMMLQNSRKACSLDRAKEGISFSSKTKIQKQKEGNRDYIKKFSSGIRRIPICCKIFFLSLPMDQYQTLGYLHLHLATRICSLPCMKGCQANTTLRVQ